MTICDRCHNQGGLRYKVRNRIFDLQNLRDNVYEKRDLCDNCYEFIAKRIKEVVESSTSHRPGTAIRYTMPERAGWWRRNGIYLLLIVGSLTYMAGGIMGIIVQHLKLTGKL